MSADSIAAWMKTLVIKANDFSDEDKLYRYNGVLYPRLLCPESNLKIMGDFQARPDDIMLVAYPKCGFNWMVEVMRKIISEITAKRLEYTFPPLIEFFGPENTKITDEAPSRRILGTHMHPDNIPASFYAKKTKMLVIFRNPKDTLVSYYHFFNNHPVLQSVQSWGTFFSNFMKGDVPWGSYFDHALAWEKRMDDPNVMIVTYEDLKQDLSQGISDISTFFGLSLSEGQVDLIAHATTFNAMKRNSISSHAGMGDTIFRKGKVGDWRKHFTAEQSQEMDDAFDKYLAGTRLGAKLNYKRHCL